MGGSRSLLDVGSQCAPFPSLGWVYSWVRATKGADYSWVRPAKGAELGHAGLRGSSADRACGGSTEGGRRSGAAPVRHQPWEAGALSAHPW